MDSTIGGWIESGGYPAIALLMFLENVFPPIPSELVMPIAGYAAARGELSLWGVIAAGSLGSLAGATLWFLIGLRIGVERLRAWCAKHGRWLTLSPADVDAGRRWFDRYGALAVLGGRLVPTVRTFISVPAGMAHMRWRTFLVFTAVGTCAWTGLLAGAGAALRHEAELVSRYLDPVSYTVIAVLVAVYVWRVITFPSQHGIAGPGRRRPG